MRQHAPVTPTRCVSVHGELGIPRSPADTQHYATFFIKAIDKSGEQYKRHVALLKILEPAAKRYTDCPMYGKICRSDKTVFHTTKKDTPYKCEPQYGFTNSYICTSTMMITLTVFWGVKSLLQSRWK